MAWAEARQVLLELELCSVTRARAYAPLVSGRHASSQPPTGGTSAADHWRERFERASDGELDMLVRFAREELAALKRRRFPVTPVVDGDDLRERIVVDGEGLLPLDVAVALRTSEAIVRRARLTAGCDPERGRRAKANGNGRAWALELVANGMSVRAAAAASGVPRSTLGDHARRAR